MAELNHRTQKPPAALNPSTDTVPTYRREPYRVFFPLGLLLAWFGVLHWSLHAIGVVPNYGSVFHSIVQIQGFMMCFAVGFLLTAVPRHTGTPPPSTASMALAVGAPIGTTIAAWFELWAVSQFFWLALMVTLITFVARRLGHRRALRRPPQSFIWVPLSLLMGTAGSLLIGVYGFFGDEYFWLHDLGRLLLLQGMFIGLVLGVGGMVLPLITRGDSPALATTSRHDRLVRAGHLTAASLLALSFWIEMAWSLQIGLALRAAVILVVLLASARIWQPPRVPGWHRILVWLAAWMIPTGYAMAAVFPAEKKAALHVVFIGGFALMAFAVGLHVILAHGGFQQLVHGRPWQVLTFGAMILVAMVLRTLVDFDRNHFFFWVGASAASFLVGTLFWAWLVFPRIWHPSRAQRSHP